MFADVVALNLAIGKCEDPDFHYHKHQSKQRQAKRREKKKREQEEVQKKMEDEETLRRLQEEYNEVRTTSFPREIVQVTCFQVSIIYSAKINWGIISISSAIDRMNCVSKNRSRPWRLRSL